MHQENEFLPQLRDNDDSRQKRLFTGCEFLKPDKDPTKPITCFGITDLTFPVFLSQKFSRPLFNQSLGGTNARYRRMRDSSSPQWRTALFSSGWGN